jgi:CRISPR system Cascade subunit CasE
VLHQDDEGFGYALHAWLTAMFGADAPRPFRFIEHKAELLGYTRVDGARLLEHMHAFAPPLAHASLVPDSLAVKPLPADWPVGRRLQMDVIACPVSRQESAEKDIYLRTLDRLGDAAPSRPEVYLDWFSRQWGQVVAIERAELLGFSRQKLLRRPASGEGRRPSTIERPQALFRAVARIEDGERFAELLARGIGRHRAFGFGMVLLSPAP